MAINVRRNFDSLSLFALKQWANLFTDVGLAPSRQVLRPISSSNHFYFYLFHADEFIIVIMFRNFSMIFIISIGVYISTSTEDNEKYRFHCNQGNLCNVHDSCDNVSGVRCHLCPLILLLLIRLVTKAIWRYITHSTAAKCPWVFVNWVAWPKDKCLHHVLMTQQNTQHRHQTIPCTAD